VAEGSINFKDQMPGFMPTKILLLLFHWGHLGKDSNESLHLIASREELARCPFFSQFKQSSGIFFFLKNT
jgi:hypothetical protein